MGSVTERTHAWLAGIMTCQQRNSGAPVAGTGWPSAGMPSLDPCTCAAVLQSLRLCKEIPSHTIIHGLLHLLGNASATLLVRCSIVRRCELADESRHFLRQVGPGAPVFLPTICSSGAGDTNQGRYNPSEALVSRNLRRIPTVSDCTAADLETCQHAELETSTMRQSLKRMMRRSGSGRSRRDRQHGGGGKPTHRPGAEADWLTGFPQPRATAPHI